MSVPDQNLLLELRPALDMYGGIPQETRLLFRGLSQLQGIRMTGLLQSSTRVLAKGLPVDTAGWSRDKQVDRLSRVVVSLQSRIDATRVERVWAGVALALAPLRVLANTLFGVRQKLTVFQPELFKDFVWRNLFARTLHNDDFELMFRAGYRVARLPWTALHAAALLTRKFGHALYPRIDTTGFDVMVVETPFPGRVSRGTRLVVRYHDAVPLLMPHTISDKAYHQASHYHALRRNARDGAWFACVSEATRKDLVSIFPEVEPRAITIPNMVSHHYFAEDSSPDRVPDILRIRRNTNVPAGPLVTRGSGPLPYLLMVSTIEPRKNHLGLLAAWEQLRAQGHGDLQLVFVGMLGWEHKTIVKKFQPWSARGGLHVLEDVPAEELRLLYRHALVTVCPSYGEGFDYSGVEAMRCGGIVAASDIPVHREVFDAAAEYFSPYAPREIASALSHLLSPQARDRRNDLIRLGAEVSSRYVPESVLPRWQDFLTSLNGTR